MYIKDEISEIKEMVRVLMDTLLTLAEAHTQTIMPGYTHLQKAQPVTFAHHVMAYFEMLRRDIGRLDDTYKRTNVCPLGRVRSPRQHTRLTGKLSRTRLIR